MKNLFFLAAWPLFLNYAAAQSQLHIAAGADFMRHSKLTGFAVANDFALRLRGPHSLVLGFELGYAEGNRNFDRKKDGNSNVEFEEYYPLYFFLPFPTYQFDLPVELKALTSTTYQLSVRAGYDFSRFLKNNRFQCFGGGYFTYIYKSYLAKTDYALNVQLGSGLEPLVIDLSYPFNLRYIDVGSYVQVQFRPFKSKKAPCLNLVYSQGFQKNSSWFTLGLSKSIAVGKTR